jgi:(1->4)-alpha-D-glucan 1-alpha-D-glucosylmutase
VLGPGGTRQTVGHIEAGGITRFLYGGNAFLYHASLDDFQALACRVAFLGALGSLSQVVLRCLSPGVPDTYQGAALWDLSFVDPDNRRPVDFAARARRLAALDAAPTGLGVADPAQIAALMRDWPSGEIKLTVLRRALALRAAFPALGAGSYEPVASHGAHAGRVVAFVRRAEGAFALVVAGRLLAAVMPEPAGTAAQGYADTADWGDTTLELPADAPGALRDIFTARRHVLSGSDRRLGLAAVLATLPVAVPVTTRYPEYSPAGSPTASAALAYRRSTSNLLSPARAQDSST